jgi:hypothetical protein
MLAVVRWAGPPNKGMKLTKPSILTLRSLSLVLDGPFAGPWNGRALGVARTNSRCLATAAPRGHALRQALAFHDAQPTRGRRPEQRHALLGLGQ